MGIGGQPGRSARRRTGPEMGHAGGRTFSRSVRNTAMELAFLLGQLGVEGEEGAFQ